MLAGKNMRPGSGKSWDPTVKQALIDSGFGIGLKKSQGGMKSNTKGVLNL